MKQIAHNPNAHWAGEFEFHVKPSSTDRAINDRYSVLVVKRLARSTATMQVVPTQKNMYKPTEVKVRTDVSCMASPSISKV